MSEEKIIQHSKKAITVIKDKNKTFGEKVKEFLGEVLIIVLAVTITLIFHNWNDVRHEKKIEREFLEGIKGDIERNADAIEGSIKDFQPTIDYYSNAWKQIKEGKINTAYIDTNSYNLINTNYFIFDDSRFEGFKSSGYLRLIENPTLLKHLVTLYSTDMPFERDIDQNVFRERAKDYDMYIGSKGLTGKINEIQVSKMLGDPAVKYQFFKYVQMFDERKRHKKALADKLRRMVKEIDKELSE